MQDWMSDVVGICGVVLVVLAYYLITAGRLTGEQLSYHLINLIGAVLILVSLLVHFNLASFIIEIVWISISIYGLWKVFKHPKT